MESVANGLQWTLYGVGGLLILAAFVSAVRVKLSGADLADALEHVEKRWFGDNAWFIAIIVGAVAAVATSQVVDSDVDFGSAFSNALPAGVIVAFVLRQLTLRRGAGIVSRIALLGVVPAALGAFSVAA
jgi:hypothetical protein